MERTGSPSDEVLQDVVELALRAGLGADAPHIGVATDRGTVTLTGRVPTAVVRQLALSVTRAVAGVRAVADDLAARDSEADPQTSTELANNARDAIERAVGVALDSVVAEVSDHVITLTGTVSSTEERVAAERAVLYLPGLRRINNRLEVRATPGRPSPPDLAALHRSS